MPFIPTRAVNPRQKNKFSVLIEGLESALVFSVQIPPVEVVTEEYCGGGETQDTKYAQRLKFGDVILNKIMPANEIEDWAWTWLTTVIDPETAQVMSPSEYKKDIEILHMSPLDIPLQSWMVFGAFPKKIGYPEQSAEDFDKIIQQVILSCDRYVEI